MKKVLVTGSRGYIGSALTKSIFFRDVQKCDIKDGQDFSNIRDEYFDVVIHLAALVSVTDSFSNPEKYMIENCSKIAAFLKNNTVERFIFTSTGGAMYGNLKQAKEYEATWAKCLSPYAQSKFVAESIIRQCVPNHIILRLGNVYGDEELYPRGEASVHRHFMTDNPIIVYGGKQTRDFIYIKDLIRIIYKATENSVIGTFNIGSGIETSIMNLAKEFSSKRRVPIKICLFRPGEIEFISLDISKAKKAELI